MIDHIHALPAGYQLQEYTVTGTLGFGGFGITYSAHDTNLDMLVAIKEYLPSELAVRVEGSTVSAKSQQDKESFDWGLERFIDEGRAVARFNHPNIIRIHRFFEQNGTGYIVMELIEGNTLAELLDAAGTLEEKQLREWLWPVMDGLKVVHSSGYIHRDIKPQNIMMNTDGVPILLDFGAARLAVGGRTRSMTSIMTPGFAPLEQYQTRGQGPWTDVYALGAVMYKCISGKKPQDALDRVTNDQLEQADSGSQKTYSLGLLRGVSAALAVAVTDRPQNIEDWLDILEERADAGDAPATGAADRAVDDGATRIMTDAPKTISSTAESDAVSGAAPVTAVPDEWGGTQGPSGIGKWVIAAAVLLAMGAGGYWWQGTQTSGPPSQPQPATIPATEIAEHSATTEPAGSPLKTEPDGMGNVANETAASAPKVNEPMADESTTVEPIDDGSMDGESIKSEFAISEAITDISEPPAVALEDNPVDSEDSPGAEAGADRSEPEIGIPFQDCDTCPVMVPVPAGRFMMSSPATEAGRAADEPAQHAVVIDQPFAIGSYEVTVAEFALFAQETNPEFASTLASLPDTQPVTSVSWEEATAFARWLSAKTGNNYRLPTEAEWEYATRAGSDTAYWWGDDIGENQAHCRSCGSLLDTQNPVPVGSFDANPFGLHEVHGNVSEWVQDCSNQSSSCSRRVFKSGSYLDQPASSRSAYRYVLSPRQSRNYLGFRVARGL